METRTIRKSMGGIIMRERKIINVYKNGNRTSISLSEIQKEVIDKLAEFYGVSKTKMLSDIVKHTRNNVNLSNAVRDWMYVKLIELLSLKGLEL